MKKILSIVGLLCLVSCSNSCSKNHIKEPSELGGNAGAGVSLTNGGAAGESGNGGAVGDAGELSFQNVETGTWSMNVPSTWAEKAGDEPSIERIFFSDEDKMLSLVLSNEFFGTLEEFALLGVRNLKDAYTNINDTQNVKINNDNWFYLDTNSGGNNQVWFWTTVHNKRGYIVSCGVNLDVSPVSVKDAKSLCFEIVSSFKFKEYGISL